MCSPADLVLLAPVFRLSGNNIMSSETQFPLSRRLRRGLLFVLVPALGFALGKVHDLRVLWARYQLRHTIVTYQRADGGWDMGLSEPGFAIEHLRQLGAGAEARACLVELLQSPRINDRLAVYVLLPDLEEEAIGAITDLLRIVNDLDRDEEDREAARWCIDRIEMEVIGKLPYQSKRPLNAQADGVGVAPAS
jgi:hypothetical protein